MYEPTFDSEKFRELVLHVSDQSRDDPWFGAVKLNKILYFCDFLAYARFLRPMTGATYVKLQEGPVPREFLRERRALLDEGLAGMEFQRVFKYMQQRLVPVKTGHVLSSMFDDGERSIVSRVLEFFGPLSGKEASDISHREMGWILADDKEVIPYESALLVNPDDYDFWAWREDELITTNG